MREALLVFSNHLDVQKPVSWSIGTAIISVEPSIHDLASSDTRLERREGAGAAANIQDADRQANSMSFSRVAPSRASD